MLIMNMSYQIIHIPQIPRLAPFPPTHRHLVTALSAVILLLAVPQQRERGGRVGDFAGRVGGDGG